MFLLLKFVCQNVLRLIAERMAPVSCILILLKVSLDSFMTELVLRKISLSYMTELVLRTSILSFMKEKVLAREERLIQHDIQ